MRKFFLIIEKSFIGSDTDFLPLKLKLLINPDVAGCTVSQPTGCWALVQLPSSRTWRHRQQNSFRYWKKETIKIIFILFILSDSGPLSLSLSWSLWVRGRMRIFIPVVTTTTAAPGWVPEGIVAVVHFRKRKKIFGTAPKSTNLNQLVYQRYF